MGFNGQTYRVSCGRGGYTANPNIDELDAFMMIDGSKNINIHENGRGPRGGTSHVDAAAMPSTPQINGIYDFTQTDGTQFVVRCTIDGKIYKDDTTTIKTGLTADSSVYYDFAMLNDSLYISNGSDRPQVWDGSAGSTTNIASVPVDWSGGSGNWPKQILIHGRGNSERAWAILSNDNNIYYSVLNDGISEADFGGAGSGQIYIDTGNEGGLTGIIELGEQLIVFTNKRAYFIDDTDASTANWGYIRAPFEGGVDNHRLLVKTDNDIYCMSDDGNVFSFTTVQAAQDYKRISISRPAYIDKWIRDNISTNSLNECHARFDPFRRVIKYFLKRKGGSQVDTCLPYFIDRGPKEGWGPPHDNLDNPSGYSAASSAIVRDNGVEKIYTGDYSGFLWELETSNNNDNGEAFYSGFKTPFIATEDIRSTKKFFRGWVLTQSSGGYNLQVIATIDTNSNAAKNISLAGAGGLLDFFVLDVDVLGGTEILDVAFDIRTAGKRISFEVFNSNADEDFFVSQLLFDYTILGARAQ